MKLYTSYTSPYARKCRALVHEMGLVTKIKEVNSPPLDDPSDLHAVNPLGKVPVLERENRPPIIGSAPICEFLDNLCDEPWIPDAGESRILVLRQQALADGMLDLTVGRRIEMTRDDPLRFALWQNRWEQGIERTLIQLDAERRQFERSVDLGALSIAIALGYLDFRYRELDWRSLAPSLIEFFDRWKERASFKHTEPPVEELD